MKFNQAARLFLAALAAGSRHCTSADPCPPVAGNCPPLQADDNQQVMQCQGCFYSGECEAQEAGFSLEDDCQAVGVKLDPNKPCNGNPLRGSKCIQTASPSEVPSSSPSATPSASPSMAPSMAPSNSPSTSPSKAPSSSPSASPSEVPWSQVAKLPAANAATEAIFGNSVAISGDTAIVGAGSDGDESYTGSAYIYEKVNGSWNPEPTKLTPGADGAEYDRFGRSVAISGDIAIIGAAGYDDKDIVGSAYIFEKVDGSWMTPPVVTKLTAKDGAADDRFGYSVAISGETAIVGDGFNSGSAYIFENIGDSWEEVAKLSATDGAGQDQFGISVAISGDTAIIGAYWDDDDDKGKDSGSAYIFEKVDGSWKSAAVTKLTAGDDGAAGDYFGYAVAISGNTAIVGADGDDGRTGSAYIFEKPGGGSWTNPVVTKLTADDGAADDSFGSSVAISGETAIVGAFWDDGKGTDSGSAYIFEKFNGIWNPEATRLTATDGDLYDNFGISVAISGETAIIGAYGDDGLLGSAYIFETPK